MEEFFHIADAHCHTGFGESDTCCAVCADACFESGWRVLKSFDSFPIKKAYGIHPALREPPFESLESAENEVFSRILPKLEKYLESADAVGETGFDTRLSARIPLHFQRRVLEAQLELAEKFGIPAILHCVGEWGALLDTMKDRSKKLVVKFLVHAAKCSPETVRELEKLGGSLSFGMRELLSGRGARCAACVSSDRIMVESDAAFSKKTISETISKLAEIRNVDARKLSERLYKNFTEFYSK